MPLKSHIYGYHTNYKNKTVIIINQNLPKMRRLEVAFHELGRHYLHALSQPLTHRQEHETQKLALLALIPKTTIKKLKKFPILSLIIRFL